MTGPYDDIINLPHHVSAKHQPMPLADRAAQFSPFAALTGYEDAVRETARLTEAEVELDEYAQAELDQALRTAAVTHSAVCITYFKPDEKKEGGSYQNVTDTIRRIDEVEKCVILQNRMIIPLKRIIAVHPPESVVQY